MGEWIQVNLPYQIYLQKISLLTPIIKNNYYTYPRVMILLGANPSSVGGDVEDGTWNTLQTFFLTNIDQPQYTGSAIDPNELLGKTMTQPLNKYSCFRLVFVQAADYIGHVSVNQWNLWGTVNRVENFTTLLSSGSPLLDENRTAAFASYNNVEGFTADYQRDIDKYISTYNTLINDDMYDYSGNLLNVMNKRTYLSDVAVHDRLVSYEMQESLHILGSIALFSVVILAIFLAK
jgi:hypothetical protein